jgi:hypothetical protein
MLPLIGLSEKPGKTKGRSGNLAWGAIVLQQNGWTEKAWAIISSELGRSLNMIDWTVTFLYLKIKGKFLLIRQLTIEWNTDQNQRLNFLVLEIGRRLNGQTASVEVLPDVDDATGDDGRAHPDDGGLLDEVEPRAENRTPASVLVNPSADLPTKISQILNNRIHLTRWTITHRIWNS